MAWSWRSASEDPNDYSRYTHLDIQQGRSKLRRKNYLGDRHLKWNLHRRLLVKKQSTKFIWVVGEALLLQIKYEGMTGRRIRSKMHERPETSSNIKPPSPELHRLVKIEAESPSLLSLSFFHVKIVKESLDEVGLYYPWNPREAHPAESPIPRDTYSWGPLTFRA